MQANFTSAVEECRNLGSHLISTKKLKKLRKGKSLKDSSFNQVYRVNAIKGKARLTIQFIDAQNPKEPLGT